ncbi:MAG: site-2 protease family protein [Ilumatobacteraceae bacterium]|nr:site-2 protease family protein [Ilumatobacteraceae bacterium]
MTGTLFYIAIGGRSVIPAHGELTPLQAAAFWAGPVIGLLNLIPVLPLDGGNMLHAALSAVSPARATQWMYVITIAITGGGLVWMVLEETARPYIVFVLLPLFAVFSSMGRDKQRARQAVNQQTLAHAEAAAWATGQAGAFPPGTRPSPWFRAWEELQRGRPDMARRLLLADLADPSPSNWWPPDAAPVGALRDLVELLPAEMTAARSFSAYALGEVLLRTGDTHRAGTFAATAYTASTAPRCWPSRWPGPPRPWAISPPRWRGCAPPPAAPTPGSRRSSSSPGSSRRPT